MAKKMFGLLENLAARLSNERPPRISPRFALARLTVPHLQPDEVSWTPCVRVGASHHTPHDFYWNSSLSTNADTPGTCGPIFIRGRTTTPFV